MGESAVRAALLCYDGVPVRSVLVVEQQTGRACGSIHGQVEPLKVHLNRGQLQQKARLDRVTDAEQTQQRALDDQLAVHLHLFGVLAVVVQGDDDAAYAFVADALD